MYKRQEQYEGKVNSSSDLYALGKTLQALAGKNWLSVLWKVPGFALFLYKMCIRDRDRNQTTAALGEGSLSTDQAVIVQADRELKDGSREMCIRDSI